MRLFAALCAGLAAQVGLSAAAAQSIVHKTTPSSAANCRIMPQTAAFVRQGQSPRGRGRDAPPEAGNRARRFRSSSLGDKLHPCQSIASRLAIARGICARFPASGVASRPLPRGLCPCRTNAAFCVARCLAHCVVRCAANGRGLARRVARSYAARHGRHLGRRHRPGDRRRGRPSRRSRWRRRPPRLTVGRYPIKRARQSCRAFFVLASVLARGKVRGKAVGKSLIYLRPPLRHEGIFAIILTCAPPGELALKASHSIGGDSYFFYTFFIHGLESCDAFLI